MKTTGPTSPDPVKRANALANLAGGPTQNIAHGVKAAAGFIMRCERCCLRDRCAEACDGAECPHELAYLRDRRESILGLPHIDEVIDGPSVGLLLWAEVRLLRWSRYLAASGETLPGAPDFLETHPAERHVSTLFNSWSRLVEKLSLTPATRRALEGAGEGGAAATIAAAIRRLATEEREAKPIDAEFEATDEEGGEDD